MADFTPRLSRTSSCPTAARMCTPSCGSPPGAGATGRGVGCRRGRGHHRRHVRLDGRARHPARALAATAALQEITDGTLVRGDRWQSPCLAGLSAVAGARAGRHGLGAPARRDGGRSRLPRRWRHRDGAVVVGRPAGFRDRARVAAQRHAILLTDGANEHETPDQLPWAIHSCAGVFQATAAGVGDRWQVDEVRRIASALLGTVDLIPRPEEMASEFQSLMRTSMSRGVANAETCGSGRRRELRCSSSSRSRRTLRI
jgi:hypothetical protein